MIKYGSSAEHIKRGIRIASTTYLFDLCWFNSYQSTSTVCQRKGVKLLIISYLRSPAKGPILKTCFTYQLFLVNKDFLFNMKVKSQPVVDPDRNLIWYGFTSTFHPTDSSFSSTRVVGCCSF